MLKFAQVHRGDPWGFLFPVENVSRGEWEDALHSVRALPKIGFRLHEIMKQTQNEYNQRMHYVGFNARLFVEIVVAFFAGDIGYFNLTTVIDNLSLKASKNEKSVSGHVLTMPLIDNLNILRMKANKAAHGDSFQPEDQKYVITAMCNSVNILMETIKTRVKLTPGKTTACVKVPEKVRELCKHFEPAIALMLMTLRIPKHSIEILMKEGYSLLDDFVDVGLDEMLSIGLPKKVAEKIVGFKEQMSDDVSIEDFLDLLQSRELFFRTIRKTNEEIEEQFDGEILDVSANEFVPNEGLSGQSFENKILMANECPQFHLKRINKVAWKPDESIVASAGEDGQLVLFNTDNNKLLYKHTSENSCQYKDIDWHQSGRIAIAQSGRTVTVYVPEKDRYVHFAPGGHIGPKNIYNTVKWSPHLDLGWRFVTGSSNKTLSIFDFNPQESKISMLGNPIKGHGHIVYSVDWSPIDKNQVASGSWDNILCIWDVETSSPLTQKTAHDHYIEKISYSPDGTLISTASADNTIKIWDTRTCESISTLRGHTNIVNSVSWSPDGSSLLSCSADKTVRLWNVGTKSQISVITAHSNPVCSISWKNNTMFASGDKIVKTWVVE